MTSGPGRWSQRLEALSPTAAVFVALGLTALLGVGDYFTGYELSFSAFYLVPVALVAWRARKGAIWSLSVFDAVFWQLVNVSAGEAHRDVWVYVWNASTRVVFFVVAGLLLNRVRELLEHERELSRRDALTGLLNRRALDEKLVDLGHALARDPKPVTVVALDLDRFKAVNDSLGHAEGDRVLRELARLLAQASRAGDLVARLGGDEFALVLPSTDEPAARLVLARLQALASESFGEFGWPVSLSLGAVVHLGKPSWPELFHQADVNLYQAKAAGRDQTVVTTA